MNKNVIGLEGRCANNYDSQVFVIILRAGKLQIVLRKQIS